MLVDVPDLSSLVKYSEGAMIFCDIKAEGESFRSVTSSVKSLVSIGFLVSVASGFTEMLK